jgi:hypothetical protein
VSLTKNSSIFSLWVEEPKFSNNSGTITLNGGLPNPGYLGTNGNVVSITFKAKKPGTASLIFSNALIRENDGLGTNILTGTNQAFISILPVVEKVVPDISSTKKEALSPVIVKLTTPIFTDYTTNIKEGEYIVVKGLADPMTRIIMNSENTSSFNGEVVRKSTIIESNDKGLFTYVSENRASNGLYVITAQAYKKDGAESETTLPIQISVSPIQEIPLPVALEPIPDVSFFSNISNSLSVVIPIVGLIILLILLTIWGWYRIWHYKEYMQKKLIRTRNLVSKSFDILNEDVSEEVKIFKKIKNSQPLTPKEQLIINQLKDDLDSAQKIIMNDIKDS